MSGNARTVYPRGLKPRPTPPGPLTTLLSFSQPHPSTHLPSLPYSIVAISFVLICLILLSLSFRLFSIFLVGPCCVRASRPYVQCSVVPRSPASAEPHPAKTVAFSSNLNLACGSKDIRNSSVDRYTGCKYLSSSFPFAARPAPVGLSQGRSAIWVFPPHPMNCSVALCIFVSHTDRV